MQFFVKSSFDKISNWILFSKIAISTWCGKTIIIQIIIVKLRFIKNKYNNVDKNKWELKQKQQ